MIIDLIKITESLITDFTQATSRQIQWWYRDKLIWVQSELKGKSSRKTREYSISNLLRIYLLRIFLDAGIPVKVGSWLVNVIEVARLNFFGPVSFKGDALRELLWSSDRFKFSILQARGRNNRRKYVCLERIDDPNDEKSPVFLFGPVTWDELGEHQEPEKKVKLGNWKARVLTGGRIIAGIDNIEGEVEYINQFNISDLFYKCRWLDPEGDSRK